METHSLIETLSTYGDRTALIVGDRRHTYAELVAAVDRMRDLLRAHSVRPGEVVAILSDYAFEAVALFLALLAQRNTVVPITIVEEQAVRDRLREAFVERVARVGGCGVTLERVASPNGRHEILNELERQGRAGLVLFSSGTTGRPKAMVHDLDRLVAAYAGRRTKSVNVLAFLLFDHIGGIDTLFRALSIGGTLTVPDGRTPDEVARAIESHRVQVLPASPTFLNLLLLSGAHTRFDLSSLQIIGFGAEPMPPPVLERLRKAFPGVDIQQKFGISETNAIRIANRSPDSLEFRIDDPNVDWKVVDGELWIKSRTRIVGYLNERMDAFTEDGWFRTGDLVEASGDGYLRICGRAKEVINVGGQKVFPLEVEAVVLEVPGIEDCVVYGVPSPLIGQMVVAEVVLAPGTEVASTTKAVRDHCRSRLDSYKVPVKVHVVDRAAMAARQKKVRHR